MYLTNLVRIVERILAQTARSHADLAHGWGHVVVRVVMRVGVGRGLSIGYALFADFFALSHPSPLLDLVAEQLERFVAQNRLF